MFNYYEMSNMIGSAIEPSAVHVMQNPTAAYFCKYLLEKAIAVFKWELPKTWDKDYFLYNLGVLLNYYILQLFYQHILYLH